MNRLFLTALVTTIIAACGPSLRPPGVSPQMLENEAALQRELLLKTRVERQAKLKNIYTRLQIANADLCGPNISPVTGITGVDRASLATGFRNAARRLYGLNDGIAVIDVAASSPAAEAGLRPRDVITGAAVGRGVMPSGWTWSGLTISDLVKVIEKSVWWGL
jgi:hypothetical protein